MEAPIIFLCKGSPPCLEYSLKQARASNPRTTIHLVGDVSNDIYDFVEHHNIVDYSRSADEFQKIYRYLGPAMAIPPVPRNLKLYSFVLNEFVIDNKIDRFLLVDIDVMIYCDVEEEFERLKEWDFSVGQVHPGRLACCPAPLFWNNVMALDNLCQFIVDIHIGKDPESWATMENISGHKNIGIPGVMAAYFLFDRSGRYRVYHVEEVVDGSTHELNLRLSINGKYSYEMESGRKKLIWKNGLPYGVDLYSKELIRFKTIHFCGLKSCMKGFYEQHS